MTHEFDSSEAKEFLLQKEKKQREIWEQERKKVLVHASQVLREYFAGQPVEVFLVGSLTREYAFREHSDVDIVLKNFQGDRFEVWPILERKIGRDVELIRYEKFHFQDHIDQYGLRVL